MRGLLKTFKEEERRIRRILSFKRLSSIFLLKILGKRQSFISRMCLGVKQKGKNSINVNFQIFLILCLSNLNHIWCYWSYIFIDYTRMLAVADPDFFIRGRGADWPKKSGSSHASVIPYIVNQFFPTEGGPGPGLGLGESWICLWQDVSLVNSNNIHAD